MSLAHPESRLLRILAHAPTHAAKALLQYTAHQPRASIELEIELQDLSARNSLPHHPDRTCRPLRPVSTQPRHSPIPHRPSSPIPTLASPSSDDHRRRRSEEIWKDHWF
ncbi:hypothetical protein V2G26_009591 [Clonostachys chloroleuca]